jgi:hypothetical protein
MCNREATPQQITSSADGVAFWLHSSPQEVAVGIVGRLMLVVAIPMFIVGAATTPQLARQHVLPSHPIVAAQYDLRGTTPELRDESNEGDVPVDLYGNEVTDAVARYKVDGTGTLYELHSPQTEVPHLGSPKS